MNGRPLLLALPALLIAQGAHAADAPRYPSKAIRFVVAYAAGGPADLLARSAAQRMSEELGGNILIDNRPGTGTIVGAEIVAKADPDGYTLFQTTAAAVSVNQHMYKKLPYNPEKDFAAVGMIGASPYGLFAHPAVPAASLKDLLTYAKANPGKLNVGIGGVGTPPHFALQMLELASGTSMTAVQYKGTAPGVSDLLEGRIQLMMTGPIAMMAHVKTGKLKALAVTSKTRFSQLPDVPAVAEVLPDYEAQSWYAIVAPAATPREVVARLNGALQKYTQSPAERQKMLAQGVVLESGSPEQLAAHIRSESERWSALIKKLGLTAE